MYSDSTSVMQYHARLVSQKRFTPNTYIEIQLGQSTQKCLLDSGCDYSMIPRRLIPKVPLEPESMDVFAANGSPIKILGSTCLNFKIEGENVTANVMVSDQVEEFMLGYDWLSSQQIIWNFNAKQILFRNIPVRLVHKNWRAPYADWLIQPKEISEGVLLARTILPDNDDYAAVRVINLTDSNVTIPLDCELGSAYMAQAIPYTNRIRAGSVTTNRPDSRLVPDTRVPDKSALPRVRSEAYKQTLPDYLLPVVKTLPDSLSPAQFETALESIHRNADVFSKDEGDLELTNLITHHINTGTARPVHEGLRRHAQTHLKIIDDSVEKMLEYGIVEPASSPWASNVVVVTKQDSTPRITLDYRGLNEKTYRDSYPLPHISACLDSFKGASYFSVLDLRSSFYQVPLALEDRDKTAFLTRRGQWRFTRLPMGTCNSPSTFQRLMDMVLRGLQWESVLVYIDDILIFANSFTELLTRQEEVFKRLRWANLKLKPSKVKLFQREITFLGHKISAAGIAMDDSKIQEILDWHIPRNVKDTRMFLGTVGYFRKYIKNFSGHAAPLHNLTKKDTPFVWTPEHQKSFNFLKTSLLTAPILGMCRDKGTFILDVDASDIAAGAVIQQEQDGMERVLSYASLSFDKHERNYCTTRKELAALVFGLKAFRQYLLRRSLSK